MKQRRLIAVILAVIFFSSAVNAYDLQGRLKEGARQVLAQMAQPAAVAELGDLPAGFTVINGKNYRGFKIEQGKFEIRVHTWTDDTGLLDNYQRSEDAGLSIVAAVNGTFYCERGVLGPVISDGGVPVDLYQSPGKLSRSFLASFRGDKDRQTWYLGETSLFGAELLRLGFKERGWFNVPNIFASHCDNLIGGGGWILRERKDVHMDAYSRQRFRFPRAEQTSRKTVIAQDSDRSLYFLVFETGLSFHQVARTFVKDKVFSKVREAIFLDGGSSSAIVVKGKYLVPPLYMVDRARFSCIQILIPELTW